MGGRGGTGRNAVGRLIGQALPSGDAPIEVHFVTDLNAAYQEVSGDTLAQISNVANAQYWYDAGEGVGHLFVKPGYSKGDILHEYGHHLDEGRSYPKSWRNDVHNLIDQAARHGRLGGDYYRRPAEFLANAFEKYQMARNKRKFRAENPELARAYDILVKK